MATGCQVRLESKSPARCIPASRPSRGGNLKDELVAEGQSNVEPQPMNERFSTLSYIAAMRNVCNSRCYIWHALQFSGPKALKLTDIVLGIPSSFAILQTHLSNRPEALYHDSVALGLFMPGLQDIQEGIPFHLLPTSSCDRTRLVLLGITTIPISLVLAGKVSAAWQIISSK